MRCSTLAGPNFLTAYQVVVAYFSSVENNISTVARAICQVREASSDSGLCVDAKHSVRFVSELSALRVVR